MDLSPGWRRPPPKDGLSAESGPSDFRRLDPCPVCRCNRVLRAIRVSRVATPGAGMSKGYSETACPIEVE